MSGHGPGKAARRSSRPRSPDCSTAGRARRRGARRPGAGRPRPAGSGGRRTPCRRRTARSTPARRHAPAGRARGRGSRRGPCRRRRPPCRCAQPAAPGRRSGRPRRPVRPARRDRARPRRPRRARRARRGACGRTPRRRAPSPTAAARRRRSRSSVIDSSRATSASSDTTKSSRIATGDFASHSAQIAWNTSLPGTSVPAMPASRTEPEDLVAAAQVREHLRHRPLGGVRRPRERHLVQGLDEGDEPLVGSAQDRDQVARGQVGHWGLPGGVGRCHPANRAGNAHVPDGTTTAPDTEVSGAVDVLRQAERRALIASSSRVGARPAPCRRTW